MKLSGEHIKAVFESQDPIDEVTTILLENNEISGVAQSAVKPLAKKQIESTLENQNISIKEALFMFVLYDSMQSQDKMVTLFEEYKNKNIEVHPDRLTFTALRFLPIDVLKNYFSEPQAN